MPQYLSPGVYVQEVPSAVQPIAGVGTSTAGFIGIVPDQLNIPLTNVTDEAIGTGDGKTIAFKLNNYPALTDKGCKMRVAGKIVNATLTNDDIKQESSVKFEAVPSAGTPITGSYVVLATEVADEQIGKGDGSTKTFNLKNSPVVTKDDKFEIRVAGKKVPATLKNGKAEEGSQVTFTNEDVPKDGALIAGDYIWIKPTFEPQAKSGKAKLCTNFGDFKKYFGDFSTNDDQNRLAHAVYGFFNNGGTRCWVTRVSDKQNLKTALETIKPIDEISLVAIPGANDKAVQTAILDHCEDQNLQDRFAILDAPENPAELTSEKILNAVRNSNYAAIYFPWIKVFDPPTREEIAVPPSGHIAGIYARVDAERGVHKAPANEVIRGALDVDTPISRRDQDGLNPDGVNVIRKFNGNITVWGARTIGGERNGEWKYINVRRLFIYLRESIDKGTQWVVFEPNTPELWAKITRNITAFLTNVWRDGALFGNTPQEAFYVKCDEEINPPEVRDQGQVVTEIGVAIVRPAEFVIFRISQWGGPGSG